jgi:hypothetical protein
MLIEGYASIVNERKIFKLVQLYKSNPLAQYPPGYYCYFRLTFFLTSGLLLS